jgi:hypothetical protein
VALAPLTKIENTRSQLLIHIDNYYDWIVWYFGKSGDREAFGYWWTVIFKVVCGGDLNFCTWGEGYLVTQHPDFDDSDRFQVYMGHMPGGTSVKSILHYGQSMKAGEFQLFDYGGNAEN